ncbi:MAG: type I DNA topoisomerase [Clostridia bacterium]|nr:type I DNA topoisomerase [Clostridia bacterium]
MANLVIVESPAKANTIKSYLGSNYKVIASKGHIRDLPKSTFGVDIENNFEPHYINVRGKGDVIKLLKKEAKTANKIFLATDPDREGEAISFHLANQLGIPLDKQCRVTFNEITKGAVKAAIKNPVAINESLVNSQQARRILDRIVGYKLSPFLWKHVKSGLSAGRVQSVATRIISEREEEIRSFQPKEFWTIKVDLLTEKGEEIRSKFYGTAEKEIKLSCEADALTIENAIKGEQFKIRSVKKTQRSRNPLPPFTTSTLQQEASKRLGFPTQKIMKIAQELYEGINIGSENGGVQGLITYMRTDSLRVSSVAQEAARSLIAQLFGEDYFPHTPKQYKAKSNSQDAHEAIRPSNVAIMPKNIKKYLTNDQFKLYKLIWERFMASQMSAAVFNTLFIDFESAGYVFKSSGSSLKFKGFLAIYDTIDTAGTEEGEDPILTALPYVTQSDKVTLKSFDKSQHFTEAPPRYNEASLIKFLEENGIGRPSTYAPIITTIIARNYVKHEGRSLVPTPIGDITTKIMKEQFPDIVDYKFTADMENKFDMIAKGSAELLDVLNEFYDKFKVSLEKAESKTKGEEIEIPPEESDYVCEKCGSKMIYKNGRFGKFLACPNYPECKNTKAIGRDGAPVNKKEEEQDTADFKCELCGGDMVVRSGKFGSFYACKNYPTCKFTKQKVSHIGVDCPKCGAKIVAKHGRRKTLFYSCERYPDCDFSSWDLPLAEKCPDCGKTLFYRKSRKTVLCLD